MRKAASVLAVAVVIGAAAAPSRAATEERTLVRPYTIARAMVHGSDTDAWIGTQREYFRARPGERWVHVSLEDQSGLPVAGRVEVGGRVYEFCSETPEALKVQPGDKVAVSAVVGPCDTAVSIATDGTIAATFSRKA